MKQPDRFVKMVNHRMPYLDVGERAAVRSLLVRHHAAVVRVVKAKKWCRPLGVHKCGYNQAIDEILAALDRLKKGTP